MRWKWRRFAVRYIRNPRRTSRYNGIPSKYPNNRGGGLPFSPVFITVLVGILLPVAVILILEARIQPIMTEVAQAQTQNYLTQTMEEVVEGKLSELQTDYLDFVCIQRNDAGEITALSTNIASINRLRGTLIAHMTNALKGIDVSNFDIPVGALFDSEFLWAKGPSIQVRAMSVGAISAEFESNFTEAGINQTLHQIILNVEVPVTIFLPGKVEKLTVSTAFCIAETVIVGAVPNTYLQADRFLTG